VIRVSGIVVRVPSRPVRPSGGAVARRIRTARAGIFLGWQHTEGEATLDGKPRDFYVRQLRDWKFSLPIEALNPAGLRMYGALCGGTLARAHARSGDRWVIIAYAAWGFVYFAYSWAESGRTVGMALFGVRVVRDDGTDARGCRAVLRTLALPLSFLFRGLGFVGILLGDQRRALHDVIADTALIYSWDALAARLRLLSRD